MTYLDRLNQLLAMTTKERGQRMGGTPELSKLDSQIMMETRAWWPHGAVLPLKKILDDDEDYSLYAGEIEDGRHVMLMMNLLELGFLNKRGRMLEQFPIRYFPSIAKILEEGWRVD